MTAPARRNRPVSYSHGVALSDETSGTGHPRRIYLDNVPSVQSSWVTQGQDIGQVALRFGASRLRKLWMSDYGCIGDPAGSLLTGTNGWRCLNGTFRALEFSGLPGDPPRGARVQMLPECDRLSDLTSEHPECINDLRKHDR